MSWSRHEANVLARAELGPNFAPSHDAANGRVARELPVASALLMGRDILESAVPGNADGRNSILRSERIPALKARAPAAHQHACKVAPKPLMIWRDHAPSR